MRLLNLSVIAALALGSCASKKDVPATAGVESWITNGDRSALLEKQKTPLHFSTAMNNNINIVVDDQQRYQTMDGFGYTLTGGSASLMNGLPAAEKKAMLKEIFSTAGNGIGISYLRLSVGASDLSAETFTYNEMPAGQTDPELKNFSIEKEMKDLVPMLKEIIAINPKLRIMGSPWTAPTWMKDNQAYRGGSLKPEYYQAYAKYFVKYIEAMKAQGIIIDAVTIQNEPLHPGNNPSMYMTPQDQANFIKTALGPVFKAAGIKTKIIIYDHNADRPDYPITILNDPEANQYIDGSAFHLYGGQISALSKVHEAFPNKNLYFTEQWVGGPGNFAEDLKWHVSTLMTGAPRNWSKTVLEWNLAADPQYRPFTPDGGCTSCLGAITIDGKTWSKNIAYYSIGHTSKFVSPGSVRIASNQNDKIQNVAYQTPEGKLVLVTMNNSPETQTFNIKYNGQVVSTTLAAGSAGTYTWNSKTRAK
ncbi:glucosylceramidase [Pedobacter sp. PLR]|uniref:glycoside hydrolase family 30 protein n=1 Tax=Pedobacter sp. PLR TaxID=2994465 RepID=UPI0022458B03|nr:glycoside hydrolase family 30 beta sandwich domain-containing protein [Pedobacter sp. PLR]MCX2450818.1 glucosylceramidase [Pedobacter sp. PLR]